MLKYLLWLPYDRRTLTIVQHQLECDYRYTNQGNMFGSKCETFSVYLVPSSLDLFIRHLCPTFSHRNRVCRA